jgi:hypothetical protein
MKNKFLKGLVASFALSVCGLANAGLIEYTDFSSWELNTENVTTIDFNANQGQTNEINRGSSFFIDGVTFSAGTIFSIYDVGHDPAYHDTGWLDLEDGNYMASFSQAITSLSFDFGDYYSNAMNLTVTTNTGEIIQGSSLADSYGFIGFTTDSAFTSVSFQTSGTTGPYWGFDNLSYGNVKVSEVPEPSTLAIFALSLIGLASRKYKKQA